MKDMRQRARSTIALTAGALLALAVSGCGLSAPKLDLTDPINVIYSTRVAITQTNDTVATAVDTGVMSSKDGRNMQTQLARAALALLLAEAAVEQGRASGDYIATAKNVLADVRKALQQQGVSPPPADNAGLPFPRHVTGPPGGAYGGTVAIATIVDIGGPMGSDGRGERSGLTAAANREGVRL